MDFTFKPKPRPPGPVTYDQKAEDKPKCEVAGCELRAIEGGLACARHKCCTNKCKRTAMREGPGCIECIAELETNRKKVQTQVSDSDSEELTITGANINTKSPRKEIKATGVVCTAKKPNAKCVAVADKKPGETHICEHNTYMRTCKKCHKLVTYPAGKWIYTCDHDPSKDPMAAKCTMTQPNAICLKAATEKAGESMLCPHMNTFQVCKDCGKLMKFGIGDFFCDCQTLPQSKDTETDEMDTECKAFGCDAEPADDSGFCKEHKDKKLTNIKGTECFCFNCRAGGHDKCKRGKCETGKCKKDSSPGYYYCENHREKTSPAKRKLPDFMEEKKAKKARADKPKDKDKDLDLEMSDAKVKEAIDDTGKTEIEDSLQTKKTKTSPKVKTERERMQRVLANAAGPAGRFLMHQWTYRELEDLPTKFDQKCKLCKAKTDGLVCDKCFLVVDGRRKPGECPLCELTYNPTSQDADFLCSGCQSDRNDCIYLRKSPADEEKTEKKDKQKEEKATKKKAEKKADKDKEKETEEEKPKTKKKFQLRHCHVCDKMLPKGNSHECDRCVPKNETVPCMADDCEKLRFAGELLCEEHCSKVKESTPPKGAPQSRCATVNCSKKHTANRSWCTDHARCSSEGCVLPVSECTDHEQSQTSPKSKTKSRPKTKKAKKEESEDEETEPEASEEENESEYEEEGSDKEDEKPKKGKSKPKTKKTEKRTTRSSTTPQRSSAPQLATGSTDDEQQEEIEVVLQCQAKGCNATEGLVDGLCEEHVSKKKHPRACLIDECTGNKVVGYQFCLAHLCKTDACQNRRPVGFRYCQDHGCKTKGCLEASGASSYCDDHVCQYKGCLEEAVDLSGFFCVENTHTRLATPRRRSTNQ